MQMASTSRSDERLTGKPPSDDELEVIENGGLSSQPSIRTDDDTNSEIVRIDQKTAQDETYQVTAFGRIVKTLQYIKTWASGGVKTQPMHGPDSFLERFAMGGKTLQIEQMETKQRKISDIKYWHGIVVDPSGNFYYRWLAVTSMAVIYNILLIVARSAFGELQRKYVALWITLDYLSDLVYVIDMGVRLKTGYLEHGLMVRDTKKVTHELSEVKVLPLRCGQHPAN